MISIIADWLGIITCIIAYVGFNYQLYKIQLNVYNSYSDLIYNNTPIYKKPTYAYILEDYFIKINPVVYAISSPYVGNLNKLRKMYIPVVTPVTPLDYSILLDDASIDGLFSYYLKLPELYITRKALWKLQFIWIWYIILKPIKNVIKN